MDREQFKGTLQTALQRLPRAVLDDIGALAKKLIVEHRTAIEAALPSLAAELQPLIAVIGFEKAMGILNTSELEADVMEVLARFGIRELSDRRCICGLKEQDHPLPGHPDHTFQAFE